MQDFTGHCNHLCVTCRYTMHRKYSGGQLQSADFLLRCFLFTWCFCHCNKPLELCLVSIPLLLYWSVCWCARAISSIFCGLLKSIYQKAGFKNNRLAYKAANICPMVLPVHLHVLRAVNTQPPNSLPIKTFLLLLQVYKHFAPFQTALSSCRRENRQLL